MRLTLDLPPELATELTEEAARLNLPLSEYALQLLLARRSRDQQPTSGAELVAYWEREGVISTRQEISGSQAHARALRRTAEKRTRT